MWPSNSTSWVWEIAKLKYFASRLDDEQALRKKSDENLLSTEQALAHKEKLLLAAFREHDEVIYWDNRFVVYVIFYWLLGVL